MTSWKSTGTCAAAFGILFSGTAAFADVTADQVWGDWKNYMTGFGYDFSANESTSGETLTVTDITMSMTLPEDEGTIGIVMGEMAFTNNGDGTVSIAVPSVMPMTMSIKPPTGESIDVKMQYSSTGYTVNVSGDPTDMTYNYAVAQADITLDELVVEGQSVDIGTASISIADIVGSSNMKIGDMREVQQKFDTGALSFDVNFADPTGSDGVLTLKGGYGGINFEGAGSFPAELDITDIAGALASGFAFGGKYTFSGGSTAFHFKEGNDVVDISTKSDGGNLEVAMDKSMIKYGGGSTNVELKMSGGEIPLPIEVAMKEWGFGLLLPISKSDEEQDFALSMTLADYTMSDLLWSLADPSGALPHDPATIAFDVTGKAKLFFDLLDEEQLMAASSGASMPGELNSVQLNSLTVSAVGAELTGNGAFTFDNSDLVTFQGLPAPTGEIDLKLVGLNGLLDNLVAMGMMPEDQVMGMRMMMGMFAVVGEGEDTLTSKIEVSGDGSISANGQRIQ